MKSDTTAHRRLVRLVGAFLLGVGLALGWPRLLQGVQQDSASLLYLSLIQTGVREGTLAPDVFRRVGFALEKLNDPRSLVRAGSLYLKAQDYPEAARAFREAGALKARPEGSAESIEAARMILLKQGWTTDRADAVLGFVYSSGLSTAVSCGYLAGQASRAGNKTEALLYYRLALATEENPRLKAPLWLALGKAYLDLRQASLALDPLSKALEYDGAYGGLSYEDRFAALYLRGVARADTELSKEAIEDFRQVLEGAAAGGAPKWAVCGANWNSGTVWMRLGQPQKASEFYLAAFPLCDAPEAAFGIRLGLAKSTWAQSHEPAKADGWLREAASFAREDAANWGAIGDVYRDVGMVEMARVSFARALQLSPSDNAIAERLSRLEAKR